MSKSKKLPPKTRVCKLCKEEKTLSEFSKSKLCLHGYTHKCLVCKRKISKKEYEANKERVSRTAQKRYKRRQEFSGDWDTYFKYLIHRPKHGDLSVQDLLEILEKQEGKCALSGEPLTAILAQGRVKTNASMDRILPGGPYEKNNVRLVCSVVNSMRLDMPDSDLFSWCEKILQASRGEKKFLS